MHSVKQATLNWLSDPADPGPANLAISKLSLLDPEPGEQARLRLAAYQVGPVAEVLKRMRPEGYWEKPGPGYSPKYLNTVWALIFLAQAGACVDDDPRVRSGADYYLANALFGDEFRTSTTAVSGIDCLQGNMLFALLRLGVAPQRLAGAMDFLAAAITGKGFLAKPAGLQRGYAGYRIGPGFNCRANPHGPCSWGAAKSLLALAAWPTALRSPVIEDAIAQTTQFFLGSGLLAGPWTRDEHGQPDPRWTAFGFPVYYITDLLQVAEGLIALGLAQHPTLEPVLDLIESKADASGRYTQEFAYGSRTFPGLGSKGKPSKWVTIRALSVLEQAGRLKIELEDT